MPKPFVVEGARAVAQMPVAFKTYRPDRLPDAAACVNCAILINDPKDNDPRPRLAISNGASWDVVGWVSDTKDVPQVADISGLVRQAIAEALAQRQEVARPSPPPLPASILPSEATTSDAVAVIAGAQLQINAQLEVLQIEMEALQKRVAFVESSALAKAEIVAG